MEVKILLDLMLMMNVYRASEIYIYISAMMIFLFYVKNCNLQ